MAKRKYDTNAVRDAARGQWVDILAKLGGIETAILDGNHYPCPKCGGTDRFRAFNDVNETGGLICNQCHSTGNGDGFASLAWLLDLDVKSNFPELLEKVATYLGIKPISDTDPEKDLQWRPWNESLAAIYCGFKPGVTEEALLANGARMARYKDAFAVIALPIIGESLDVDKPVGWVVTNATGGRLPKYNKQGEEIGQVTWKITYGSKPGLVGNWAIVRLMTPGLLTKVWKCEGMSDFLTLFGQIPAPDRERIACLTNANGSRETPRWQAASLAPHDVLVCHDADEPGQTGAETWTQAIAKQQPEGKTAKNVKLPYEVSADHGKDLRDYFAEGHKYSDLEALADKMDAAAPLKKTVTGDVDYSDARFPVYERILKKLQIEILYEDEDDAIHIFSAVNRKSSKFASIDKITKNRMLQFAGPPASEVISEDSPDGERTWSIKDVRAAIAALSSPTRGQHDERGVGIWQGKGRFGHQSETIVLVNRADGARWNGDQVLRPIAAPRADGLVLNLGSGERDWFDFETLQRYLEEAKDYAWREEAMTEAFNLFSKWNWAKPDVAPQLMVGLVMATWIQTVWSWRPLVSLIGESNCGKSLLFEALAGVGGTKGIFGGLEFKNEKSTLAGIIQGINNTAKVVMIDEFEKAKDREAILELLRVSTRGGTQAQGSSGGKAVKRRLQHIVWVAAIESGLRRQPDINRFIQLNLLPAEKGMEGKLRLPSESALETIGQKLLAIAVRFAITAKALAVDLKSENVEGIDPRSVESYAVPAAMLAAASDRDRSQAAKLLRALLTNVEYEEQGATDHEDLLEAILTAEINAGPKYGQRTVGQILSSPALLVDLGQQLEAKGIRMLPDGRLFIAHKSVAMGLLKGTGWERQRIDQILLRMHSGGEKASRAVQRLSGRPIRGVIIPSSCTPGQTENATT